MCSACVLVCNYFQFEYVLCVVHLSYDMMCLSCSGIISQDKAAIDDAMVSVKRNGVGLKG